MSELPAAPPPSAHPPHQPPPGSPDGPTEPAESPGPAHPTFTWLLWLLVGVALWAVSVAVVTATKNIYLVPTVVLLGSFTVPAAFTLRAHERYGSTLGQETIIRCFAVGGVLGVLGSSLLEHYLLRPSFWIYVGVALIEEAVKLGCLVLITRRLPVRGRLYGLVLGGAVGFGFAAFESAGYALDAVINVDGLDLRNLVETETVRGLLAPVGHGLWTGLMGAVLFHHRRGTRFRITPPVVLTFLGVSALHAFWDSASGIAVWLTALVTAHGSAGLQDSLNDLGYLRAEATDQQTQLYTLFNTLGLLLASALGLLWLWRAVPVAMRPPPGFTDALLSSARRMRLHTRPRPRRHFRG